MDVSKYQEIEKYYFNFIGKNYSKNKALRNIALRIGLEFNDLEKAEYYLNQIILKNNEDYKEYLFLGGVYMKLGLLEKGWKYYKYRTLSANYNCLKNDFNLEKEWKGENLINKTIYILAEQGIGDCIMWSRYLPLFKNCNIKLYVKYNYWKKIIPILDYVLRLTAGNNNLVITDTVDKYDYWIFLGDLTYIFKINFKNWLPFYEYIKPDEKIIKLWKNRLKIYKKNKLIGINCTGLYGLNDNRRIDVDDIKKLLDNSKNKFINLNIEHEINHENVIKHGFEIDKKVSFLDTAGIMKNLDLFITVDTSLVHLAGAMKIPTILLLIKDSEWRWFNTNKCYWYPTVKIFRQKENNWNGLNEYLKKIINEL